MSVASGRTGSVFDIPTAKSVLGRKSVIGGGSVLSAATSVNVKAVVRVRPPNRKETDASDQMCLDKHEDSCSIRPPGADADKAKSYNFDKVYWTDAGQEVMYRCAVGLGVACVSVVVLMMATSGG